MQAHAQGESERQTRAKRIDRRLREAGWSIQPWREGIEPAGLSACALTEYPTANGPADYALVLGGEVVGIVEAKRVSLATLNVLEQAKRYAAGIPDSLDRTGGFGVPFLYSTNGEQIYFADVRAPGYRSRELAGFHTPQALAELLGHSFEKDCAWLLANPNQHSTLRPYQIEATEAIERAVAAGQRQMLVAMATGTGKTYTAVSLIYRLIKSGVVRRVLFLVDRRALAAQAVQALATFEAEPNQKFDRLYEVFSQRFHRDDLSFDKLRMSGTIATAHGEPVEPQAQDERGRGSDGSFDPKVLPASYLTQPGPVHTFVYVCTIQRMAINLFGRERAFALYGDAEVDEDSVDKLDIPIHAFDLVIADECHRGYTSAEQSVWRAVLEHFDAIRVGLTATPAAHTTAYFKEIVYRYEYERAVREGYLVDYDAVKISSGVRMNGVFLQEGDTVDVVDVETGNRTLDQLEDERVYDASAIEKEVTAPDSNRKVIAEVARYAEAHEQRTGRFPKTLIFAANDQDHTSHADQLVQICREQFGRGDDFVVKITGKTDRPLQRIREFRNRPQPGVAVTVDMLTTGVDFPSLEFLVFLRPVKSRILWEQMLGRGTRTCDEINKSHFMVFDCFDGTLFEYFKNASAFTLEPPEKPYRTLAQIVEDIWQNRDRDYNVRALCKRLQRIDKEMSGDARALFAAYIPDGDVGAFAMGLPAQVKQAFTSTLKTLRDPDFQYLCNNYPKPKRGFVIARDVQDEVSSEYLVRTADGRELRRDDYLIAFSHFVREHESDIDAIAVLLGRPSGWGTEKLAELRRRLTSAPERFNEENLRRAYRQELADIISMVKHAAREDEPLLSSAERAERAVERVATGRTLTAEQELWLDRIGRYLAENLTIEREAFEIVPVLADYGGWARADRAFNGELETLLLQCNEAMAA